MELLRRLWRQHDEELAIVAKDPRSSCNGCPTVYSNGKGELVIQGPKVGWITRRKLKNLLRGETAVRISEETFSNAANELLAQHKR